MGNDIYLGDRFFAKDGNPDYTLRIVRIKNPSLFMCKRADGKYIKIGKKDLVENYIRLTPAGILFNSIVTLVDPSTKKEEKQTEVPKTKKEIVSSKLKNNMKDKKEVEIEDVMVTLFRMKDYDDGINEPFAVCRQFAINVYDQMSNSNPYLKYCGISMNRTTSPLESQFEEMQTFDKMKESKVYTVYLDDNLDSIMELIDKKYLNRMDSVLQKLKREYGDNFREGFKDSYKELLESVDFMMDFYMAWGIIRCPFKITEMAGLELEKEHREYIEYQINESMLKTYVIPFNYSIDMSSVKRSYSMIVDSDNKLYIIAFDKGVDLPDRIKDNIKRNRDAYDNLKKFAKQTLK